MTHLLFDLRQTNVYRAVNLRRTVFGLPGVIVTSAILLPLILNALLRGRFIPVLIAAAILAWTALVLESFRRYKLEAAPEMIPENIAELLSYHMALHLSAKTSVTPLTLIEAATESERGRFVLQLIGIDRNDILADLLKSPIGEPLETCIGWCQRAMIELQTKRFDSTATLYAYLKNVPALKSLIEKADLSPEDLKNVLKAEAFHFEVTNRRHHPLSPSSLVRVLGSIGRTWVLGYNSDLERLTVNLSEHILSHKHSEVVHAATIESLEKMLGSGSSVNVLLLGAAGTGKRTIVRNLAYQLRLRELLSLKVFTDVLQLKTALLLSGSGDSDVSLLHALNDAKQGGRFILVIEDTAILLKAADAKLKGILISILQSKNIRTICIADTADYHTLIKTDPLLDNLLQKIVVDDTSDSETMNVLLEEYFTLARKRKIHMQYGSLKALLQLSKRYIAKGGLPGKAVDILRESMENALASGSDSVSEELIRSIISRRTRIDISKPGTREKDALQTLQQRLQSHIIGQRHAIEVLVAALKRSRLNVGAASRPIGTFLFMGTTGLGKTETAKALAQEYFGSAERMIRIDMNEFSTETSVPLLIGGQTDRGFTEGALTKKVQDEPFSLLLLDEIEKAHPKILNLFLQILDEGTLRSGDGLQTDFKNTIIIATSNAGGVWMRDHQMPDEEAERESFRTALIETVLGERTFSPEFINRFDEVIVFAPPTGDEVRQLAILMLDSVVKRFTDDKGIRLTVEPDVIDMLAKKGFSTEFGAREMRRTITQTVENYLAEYLLTHETRRGTEIVIRAEDIR